MKDVRFVFEEDEEDEEEEKAKNRHLRADLQPLSAATVSEGTHHSQPQSFSLSCSWISAQNVSFRFDSVEIYVPLLA